VAEHCFQSENFKGKDRGTQGFHFIHLKRRKNSKQLLTITRNHKNTLFASSFLL
jgi:hypothetical protein